MIDALRAARSALTDRVGAPETGAAAILVALLLPFVLGLSAVGLNYASLLNERRALITASMLLPSPQLSSAQRAVMRSPPAATCSKPTTPPRSQRPRSACRRPTGQCSCAPPAPHRSSSCRLTAG
jgi:hypothetical protein